VQFHQIDIEIVQTKNPERLVLIDDLLIEIVDQECPERAIGMVLGK
jgi:hypothetical protein